MSNKEDGNNQGIFGQAFNADGTRDGAEFQVNTTTQGAQQAPAAAVGASGNAIIAWWGPDGAQNQGIAAQSFLTAPIAPPNQAPTVSDPASQAISEDTSLTFSSANSNALGVADTDANGSTEQVTLTATNGTITLGGTSSITLTSGTGTADSSVTFVATIANLNTAMAGLVFTPTAHFSGSAGLSLTINDLGHSGSGGPLTATTSVAINVARLAHAPTISNSTAAENSQSVSGLVISRNALDSGLNGFFKITGITGGTLYQNDGVTPIASGSYITFAQGETGLKFSPTTNSVTSGGFTAQASTSASDAGLGGSTASATISVNPVPLLALPGAQSVNEDASIIFSSANGNAIVISDPGVPNGTATVTLSTAGGTLSLGSTSGITFNSGTGTNDTNVSFTGTFSALNNALNGLQFVPTLHSFGSTSISVATREGPTTSAGSIAVSVARLAHTSSATNSVTDENTQSSSGLVLSANSLDAGDERGLQDHRNHRRYPLPQRWRHSRCQRFVYHLCPGAGGAEIFTGDKLPRHRQLFGAAIDQRVGRRPGRSGRVRDSHRQRGSDDHRPQFRNHPRRHRPHLLHRWRQPHLGFRSRQHHRERADHPQRKQCDADAFRCRRTHLSCWRKRVIVDDLRRHTRVNQCGPGWNEVHPRHTLRGQRGVGLDRRQRRGQHC